MVDKRLTSRKSLESDDYLKDDNGSSFSVEETSLYNAIYERADEIKKYSSEDVARKIRWNDLALFDLPAYASNKDPEVTKQLGAVFDMNDAYNISCQVWDKDDFSADDHIGTVDYEYAEEKFIGYSSETGEFLPGPKEFGWHATLFEMAAAENPNPECLKEMIRAGADLNNGYNKNALHFAVKYNNSKVVQFLIEQGMDVNAVSEKFNGKTAIQIALEQGDGKKFEILARSGALFDKKNLKKIVPQEEKISFVNELSPEMREELGYPKEGFETKKEARSTAKSNASLYLSKFAQPQKDTEPVQKTGKER